MMPHLCVRPEMRLAYDRAAEDQARDLLVSQTMPREKLRGLKKRIPMTIQAIFWTGFVLVMISQAPNIDVGPPAPSLESLSQIHQERPASAARPAQEADCIAPCVPAVWTERVIPQPTYRISPPEIPLPPIHRIKSPDRHAASNHAVRRPGLATARKQPRHPAPRSFRRK